MTQAVQRIDKWLWHARFARTRTAAQRVVRSGRLRVNRAREVSPSRLVKIGDVLTLSRADGVSVISVLAIRDRRGPAVEARGLYQLAFTPIETAREKRSIGVAAPPSRPGKRDRRLLQEMKRFGME